MTQNSSQNILDKADAVLRKADDAITSSNQLLSQLNEEEEEMDKHDEQGQNKIDEEIAHIVEDTNKATLQFIDEVEKQ
ncbi:MAG: hypothetical protein KKF39_04825 [Nanoarchaeota archaeon]|nr:hypothetical protein [Nanoarchaeota archaeon]